MFGKAGEFNCKATDIACLCKDTNFMNGIVDCSRESCPGQGDADKTIGYAVSYCAGRLLLHFLPSLEQFLT